MWCIYYVVLVDIILLRWEHSGDGSNPENILKECLETSISSEIQYVANRIITTGMYIIIIHSYGVLCIA